ncbi:hypothetical protein HK099_004946, partial [Clydaea vesicula]
MFSKLFKRSKKPVKGSYSTTHVRANEKLPSYQSSVFALSNSEESVTLSNIDEFISDYEKHQKNVLAQTVLTHASMTDVLLNNQVKMNNQEEFELKISTEGNITNQKSSGRCWIFSTLSAMRRGVMEKYHLEEFELSQSFVFFYDKVEKSNYFLETIINITPTEVDDDSRLLQSLFSDPVADGGEWSMVVELVEKYGIVPKSAYPESHNSENTAEMNWLLTRKLREYAIHLRKMILIEKKSIDEVRKQKLQYLNVIYKILCTCLGSPPKEFDWKFRCKNGEFHSYENLTPQSFYKENVSTSFGSSVVETVLLANDPRFPYYKPLVLEHKGNVYGKKLIQVNVPIEVLKEVSILTLKNDQPVQFECDVGMFFKSGIMDLSIINYEAAFDVNVHNISKADRVKFKESKVFKTFFLLTLILQPTHDMLLTGCHFDAKGNPLRWRVQNSWGVSGRSDGYE